MFTCAEGQFGLITGSQLRDEGLTRRQVDGRVATGELVRVTRGVYRIAGAPTTWEQQALAAVLAHEGVVSHSAAARVWAIPGFDRAQVEVSVPMRKKPVGDLSVHRPDLLPPHHVTSKGTIVVTTPARTIFDLAAQVHPKRVERALDNAISMRLTNTSQLLDVTVDLAKRGRRGTTLMRTLLEARGEGFVAPASELEARMLELLEHAGLPFPERERNLGDREGWVGRVEFVYRDAQVLIELDSRRHHSQLLDREHDRQRDNRFMATGWRVLRFTWDDLRHRPHEVIRLVGAALAAAA